MPTKLKTRWSEGWEDFEFPTPSQQKELKRLSTEQFNALQKEENYLHEKYDRKFYAFKWEYSPFDPSIFEKSKKENREKARVIVEQEQTARLS